MIIVAKSFSPKNAFAGAIIGVSIGLGMLDLNACVSLATIGAVIFGYKEPLEKQYIKLVRYRKMIDDKIAKYMP